jgi:hypothetical protein
MEDFPAKHLWLPEGIWVWVNTYRYIFSGMNIHLPAILGFTRYQGFDPSAFVEMLKSNMVKFASPGHHTMLCQQIFEQLSGPFHLPEKLPQRECSGCSVAWDMLGYSFFMSLSFFSWGSIGGVRLSEKYCFGHGYFAECLAIPDF